MSALTAPPLEIQRQSKRPERVLYVSDIHRGAAISNLSLYEKPLLKKMKEYDHIVMNGDIFELFYIDPDRLDEKHDEPHKVLRHAIRSSIKWLENIIKENPDCKLHFVLGNHEAVRKFRRSLDRLHEKYPHNFEWDPEAIRLGDALITHGDLQMARTTDEHRHTYRLRDAKKEQRWSYWMDLLDEPGQAVVNYLRRPHAAVGMVAAQLKKWAGKDKFHYLDEGERKPLTMDWVKHVFFGHTHVKFHNIEHDGIQYHNTGSFTRSKSYKPEMLGVLESTLEGGVIGNIRAVEIEQHHSR